jgi:hypothetical protein
MEFPDYWKQLNWVKGWNPDYRPSMGSLQKSIKKWLRTTNRSPDELVCLIEEYDRHQSDTKEAAKKYHTSWLPPKTELYKGIAHYLRSNITGFSYSSCKAEDARMARAKKLLKGSKPKTGRPDLGVKKELKKLLNTFNPSQIGGDRVAYYQTAVRIRILKLQKAALEMQLTEKHGPAKPPKTQPIEVSRIKVIKQDDVWKRYYSKLRSFHFDKTDPILDFKTFKKKSSRGLFHRRGSTIKKLQKAMKEYHKIPKRNLGARHIALTTLREKIVAWVEAKFKKNEWDSNTRKDAVMLLLAQVDEALEATHTPDEYFSKSPIKKIEWTIKTKNFPVINDAVGEVYLLHGTTEGIMKLIANGGFRPDLGANYGTKDHPRYGALGQGSYFSDAFGKVMTYTLCPRCLAYLCDCKGRDGKGLERYTMLTRTLLGVPKSVFYQESQRKKSVKQIPKGKESVYGKVGFRAGRGNFTLWDANEFLVKSADQIYPEFLVYWRWK